MRRKKHCETIWSEILELSDKRKNLQMRPKHLLIPWEKSRVETGTPVVKIRLVLTE